MSSGGSALTSQDALIDYLGNYQPLGNGAMVETVDTGVSSDGATITFTYEKSGGGDLTCLIGGKEYPLAAGSVALTAGTEAVPQVAYVYVSLVAGVATAAESTTAWPASDDYCPLGTTIVQTEALVQSQGPLKHHAWTDHLSGSQNGHLAHLSYWIRQQNATWASGCSGTTTIVANGGAADNVTFEIASGVVLQLHPHTMPAIDQAVGPTPVICGNGTAGQTITPYKSFTDMNTVLTDTSDVSMSGKYFNIVWWGVVNEDTGDCQLFFNIPTGSYNISATAIADDDRTAIYAMPTDFRGTSFLIGRSTFRHQTAASGTWTESNYEDLRGTLPTNIAGGGATPVNDFSDAQFTIFDNADNTKIVNFQVSGVTAATTRTMTIPNNNVTLMGYVAPPAAANSTGTAGTFAYDGTWFYVCQATDTWLKVGIATW